jgi:hypothetical protein
MGKLDRFIEEQTQKMAYASYLESNEQGKSIQEGVLEG